SKRVILQKVDAVIKITEVDLDEGVVKSNSTLTNLFVDGSDRSLAVDEQYDVLLLLSKFGALLIFFFLCDRTRLFSVVNKSFSWTTFWIPLLVVVIIGSIFTGKTNQTKINHVDITREWKGWMQLYLLIYHFAGGYSLLTPFMWARVCVSSYLFLSGFGHFVYFWRQSIENPRNSVFRSSNSNRNGVSFVQSWWSILQRYLDVMFRMNFFVAALCFVMDVDYLFYYFMPLISFWFTVIVILMTVGSCKSASTVSIVPTELPTTVPDEMPSQPSSTIGKMQFFNPHIMMLFKFALLIVLIEIVYRVHPLFHSIFYGWFIRIFFKLDKPEPNVFKAAESTDVLAERIWFYRWSLDRYATLWGMLFAFCCEWLRHLNLVDDSTCSDLVLFNRKSSLIQAEKCQQLSAKSVLKSLSRISCLSTVRQNSNKMFGKIREPYFMRMFPACATILGLGGLIVSVFPHFMRSMHIHLLF
ncbi:N-acetylneuraminate 9-O-acetyltransferase, partial [Paragonimus westermani]